MFIAHGTVLYNLRWPEVVRFCNLGRIVDQHCLNFLLIILFFKLFDNYDMNAVLHCYYNQYVYDAEHKYIVQGLFYI